MIDVDLHIKVPTWLWRLYDMWRMWRYRKKYPFILPPMSLAERNAAWLKATEEADEIMRGTDRKKQSVWAKEIGRVVAAMDAAEEEAEKTVVTDPDSAV